MTDTAGYGNTASSYGSIARLFHWLTAALILTLIPLGFIANAWPYDTPDALAVKFTLFSLHKTLGVTVFFVALLRILWAVAQPRPHPLHPDRRLETSVAETVHWALYLSLVAVPLSGWLYHASTTGFAPIWWPFGQHLPFIPVDETLAHYFQGAHYVFTRLLIATLALHVVGAIKHQVVDRDATLNRMLRGTNAGMAQTAPSHSSPVFAAVLLWALAVGTAITISRHDVTSGEMTRKVAGTAESGWSVTEGTLGIEVSQMNATIEGSFANWTAAIDYDQETGTGDARVEIDITSLTLGSVTRQALGPDFFAAEDFPTAIFEGDISKLAVDQANDHILEGTLTLKGVSQPVTLPFELEIIDGVAKVTGATSLDRRDFAIGSADDDGGTVGTGVNVIIALSAEQEGTP